MGCLHDAVVAAIVGATGRTSVYTRQLSARLYAQSMAQPVAPVGCADSCMSVYTAQSIGATSRADRLLQQLLHVNTP